MPTTRTEIVDTEDAALTARSRSIATFLFIIMVLGSVSILFTGCGIVSRSAEINSFIGKPASELIRARGTPSRYERDRNGNQIYVYEWDWESTYEVPGRAWRDSSGLHWTNPRVETRVHRERRSYYVNPQGMVFDGSWNW